MPEDHNTAASCGYPSALRLAMHPTGLAGPWEDIIVPNNYGEPINRELVVRLADDIRSHGLLHYIGVAMITSKTERMKSVLIWGRHRLEAWKILRAEEQARNALIPDELKHSHEYNLIPMVILDNPTPEFMADVRIREDVHRKHYDIPTLDRMRDGLSSYREATRAAEAAEETKERKRVRAAVRKHKADRYHQHDAVDGNTDPIDTLHKPWMSYAVEALKKAGINITTNELRGQKKRLKQILTRSGVVLRPSGKYVLDDRHKLTEAAMDVIREELLASATANEAKAVAMASAPKSKLKPADKPIGPIPIQDVMPSIDDITDPIERTAIEALRQIHDRDRKIEVIIRGLANHGSGTRKKIVFSLKGGVRK